MKKNFLELREYAREFQEKHGRLPNVVVVDQSMLVKNEWNTSFQHPWKWGKSGTWIDYWCAFANGSGFTLLIPVPTSCPAKVLGQRLPLSHLVYHNTDIVGAHVKISRNRGMTWSWQTYIVPLCSECNGKHGQIVNVQPGTRLVEVVDPVIEQIYGTNFI